MNPDEKQCLVNQDAFNGNPVLKFLRAVASALLAACVGFGCTTIPQGEFQNYRRSFDEARTQSQNVLADFAAARREKSNLVAQAESTTATTVTELPLEVRLGLGKFDVRTPAGGAEDIEARLQAWEILDQYNRSLLALAAGRSPQEVEGAVNGLLAGLQKIPIKPLTDAIGDMVPYASVISGLIELIQKEVEARRFRSAVLAGAPLMRRFVECLLADANHFGSYREALFNLYFTRAEAEMIRQVGRFRSGLGQHSWEAAHTNAVNRLVGRVNAARVLTSTGPSFTEVSPNPGAAPPGAAIGQDVNLVQLEVFATAIEARAATARELAARFIAYRELMNRYGQLLQELSRTQEALTQAATSGRPGLPSAGQLERVIANLRMAYTIYLQNR